MNDDRRAVPAFQGSRTCFSFRRAEAGMTTNGSIAPPSRVDGMDHQRAFDRTLHAERAKVRADLDGRLMILRERNLRLAVVALEARGRVPRVCLYALAANGEEPTRSVLSVRAFAVREGWQVGAGNVFVDSIPTRRANRSGWVRVQRQVQSGFADGVVALTQSAIAPRRDVYEAQIRWFAEHFGFIALVNPEVPVVGQR